MGRFEGLKSGSTSIVNVSHQSLAIFMGRLRERFKIFQACRKVNSVLSQLSAIDRVSFATLNRWTLHPIR